MRPTLLVPCLIMLAACGTKTPLTHPPGPAQPPLFGTASPAKPKPAPPAPASPAPASDDNKPATGAVAP